MPADLFCSACGARYPLDTDQFCSKCGVQRRNTAVVVQRTANGVPVATTTTTRVVNTTSSNSNSNSNYSSSNSNANGSRAVQAAPAGGAVLVPAEAPPVIMCCSIL